MDHDRIAGGKGPPAGPSCIVNRRMVPQWLDERSQPFIASGDRGAADRSVRPDEGDDAPTADENRIDRFAREDPPAGKPRRFEWAAVLIDQLETIDESVGGRRQHLGR